MEVTIGRVDAIDSRFVRTGVVLGWSQSTASMSSRFGLMRTSRSLVGALDTWDAKWSKELKEK